MQGLQRTRDFIGRLVSPRALPIAKTAMTNPATIVLRNLTSSLSQQDFDAPVLRRHRIVGNLQIMIGGAFNFFDPLRVEPAAHEHVERHLRARGREPPVVVSP